MLSRSTYSLAVSVLAAGILTPCLAPLCVRAGDKIEFSTPTVSIGVPVVQHLQKDTSIPEYRLGSAGADVIPDVGVPQETMVIVGKAKRDGSDSIYGDDSDTFNDDPYAPNTRSRYSSAYNNPYAHTNSLDARPGWGTDSRSMDRGLDNASQDNLRASLDGNYNNYDRTGQKKYEQDDRFAPRDGSSDQDSVWSKRMFHLGLNRDTGSTGEEYLPSYQQMKLLNDQFMGVSEDKSTSPTADQSGPNSPQPSVTDYNFPEEEAARRNSEDAAAATPSYYHPFELKNGNQSSGYTYGAPPSQSYGSQSYEPPAVLPFPKRPGSLFK